MQTYSILIAQKEPGDLGWWARTDRWRRTSRPVRPCRADWSPHPVLRAHPAGPGPLIIEETDSAAELPWRIAIPPLPGNRDETAGR
jgi:hypothetical protein